MKLGILLIEDLTGIIPANFLVQKVGWFQRRKLKCEKFMDKHMDERQWVSSEGNLSNVLCTDKLKTTCYFELNL